MANILVLTANLGKSVLHKESGGAERTTTLIEALTDHNVTVLSFGWDSEEFDRTELGNIRHVHVGVEYSVLKNQRVYVNQSSSRNRDLAIQRFFNYLKKYRAKVRDLAEVSDLVIVDHASASPFIADVGDTPVVYNSHNCEAYMAHQLYPKGSEDIAKTIRMEGNAISGSVAMTYCSPDDLNKMAKFYDLDNIRSHFVPNGGPRSEAVSAADRMKSNKIMFVGSGHPPNGVAARNIIPIALELPEYEFLLCGDSAWVAKDGAPKNVKILGRVSDEDLDEYFKESLAFINPMETGSGTHLKMMKALGYGIPIITSTVGARGFEEDEIRLSMIIADDTKANVEAIKSLSNSKIVSNLIDGSRKVFDRYDWEVIKKDYQEFINEIIKLSPAKESELVIPKERKKVLLYSIVRNNENSIDRYYEQVKSVVKSSPDYEFFLSLYENDSTDGTKRKIFQKDWSFFSGVSIISENINTPYFGSVKDALRVELLSNARNKAIEAGGFLDNMDYILMIEGDNQYETSSVRKLLDFHKLEPDFDVVSSVSVRKNNKHYDCWATRVTAEYNPNGSDLESGWSGLSHGRYYSTSNGICLYKAEPFKEGVRHGWINNVTNEFDCEMVVVCQNLRDAGYQNIFIKYDSISRH